MIGSERPTPFSGSDDEEENGSEFEVSEIYLSMDDPNTQDKVSELIRDDGRRALLQEGYIKVYISQTKGETAEQYSYKKLLEVFEKKVFFDFRSGNNQDAAIERQAREILEDPVLRAEFFAGLLKVYVLQDGKEPRAILPFELNIFAGRLGTSGTEYL